jgi:predicted ABC-type ATPase
MSKKQPAKRMRVFAGPNGSGKSTLIKEVQQITRIGVYINADDIEKSAREKKFVNLGDYGLESTPEAFKAYLDSSTLLTKVKQEGFRIDLSLSNNVIRVEKDTNSYEAALIADYLRNLLIIKGETFSFETVMSHPSKLDTFIKAHKAGFKNYLYFIATDSAEISAKRVEERVEKGGHSVDTQKIIERYTKSLGLLSDMIPYCHRCYVLDNSMETGYRLILEIEDNDRIFIHDDEIPVWVETYVLNKIS